MIIAIDGPAGSGKSTVAKTVARRLTMHYLDTGAMYRSVAWAALRQEVPLDDLEAIARIAGDITISFTHDDVTGLPTRVTVDGTDVTTAIRMPRIDDAVSAVASMPEVRAAMVPIQRAEAERGDLVAEGRDIGTVVFPDAELKVYLIASPEERARRRHLELAERGEVIEATMVQERMAARDDADTKRTAAPLMAADDAVVLDTTGLSIDEVVVRIAALAEERS